MLNRRSFLIGISTITTLQIISGCSDSKTDIEIRLLSGSIPSQLFKEFTKNLAKEKKFQFKLEEQLQDLFNLLNKWQEDPSNQAKKEGGLPLIGNIPFLQENIPKIADLITVSDYSLKEAIGQKLIEPLEISTNSHWQKLPRAWQELVKRNEKGELDPNGKIWAAPYRCGYTAIVYNEDKFKKFNWRPQDWQDLWRVELRDRLSLLNNPREIIGLTLKKLGHSYNTEDLQAIPNLKKELQALHEQVKFYDSERYLQPLILEDTWVAVGWSSDILSILSKYPYLKAIVPQSGTSLWNDLWVKPKGTRAQGRDRAIVEWIDFCWQNQSANQISIFTDATSPILFAKDPKEISTDLINNPLKIIPSPILKKSEFIDNLSAQSTQQYESLWQEVRRGTKI
jgi:putative spermidine/putrescine transport system substrate-binding protein